MRKSLEDLTDELMREPLYYSRFLTFIIGGALQDYEKGVRSKDKGKRAGTREEGERLTKGVLRFFQSEDLIALTDLSGEAILCEYYKRTQGQLPTP